MTTHHFNFNNVDTSWQSCLHEALELVDKNYLKKLTDSDNWLPGPKKIFSAFSLPVDKVQYVLFGESPYPREQSANGYAFWDAAVADIWSAKGLSKQVNRATSLRNIIKMLLIAENALKPNQTTQEEIIKLDKKDFVQTNDEFFKNMLRHGFLLLNASLVLQEDSPVKKDAVAWQPFIKHVLQFLLSKRPDIQLLLFGQIANTISQIIDLKNVHTLDAEHPYNISFITNAKIINFFRPLHLLINST